jgi:MFS family permease
MLAASSQRGRLSVAHLVDKVGRANVVLLGILWSALGICVLAALAYDVAQWFDGL